MKVPVYGRYVISLLVVVSQLCQLSLGQYIAVANPGGLPFLYPNNFVPQQPYYPQPPRQELINLGSQLSDASPCATILTRSNCILRVPDDGRHNDIQARKFVFAAALIKDKCFLTVKDCTGFYTTSSTYLPPPPSCFTAASVCCECNGCNRRNIPLYDNSGAVLFENSRCSYCNGFRLEVAKGDRVAIMNPMVSRKVSSIYLVPGCQLHIFTQPNFTGYAALVQANIDILPPEWNDVIASYYCYCPPQNDNGTTTETPSLSTILTYPPTISSTTDGPASTSTISPPYTTSLPTSSSPIPISTTTESLTSTLPSSTTPPSSSTLAPTTIQTTNLTSTQSSITTTDSFNIY